ncbi:hypothetical protein [Bradyrhizobium stylosanthis]|uniref:Ti type entry exclusion protein TrbK n=1 Tax=Bradyrhizobium stylosanthis TaxID=1803665 RepID=A0A560DZ22_9BRAD|nr:hypothetical protein [Bradyrhizobium stylosanthis]TWB02348.1 hypothetical protein FBZ96_1031130 [Bradyrhizobium stylosanthis]
MKLLMISGLAAFGLFLAATNMQRPHPPSGGSTPVTGMPAIQEMQKVAQPGKLPTEDFEDRSLVFPREAQR